jgi:plastocyanin
VILIQFSKSFLNFSSVGVIGLLVVTAPLLLMSMSTNSAYLGATNNAYAQQSQTEQPSYFITIIPGSDIDSPSHYSPENVAIPTGTTVVWVNQDQGQRHTVTSGMPGNNTGLFDSGPMTFGDQFQLSFYTENNLVGEFPYYDTVNPEITGKISSNNMVVPGQSFEFRSGTGPTLDLAKNNATLLSFTPIGMSVDQDDIMYYNFSITRDSNNETLFENQFEVEDNKFEVELIQTDNVIAGGGATTTTGNNTAIWFGPDVDVDYTGAYHAAGDFFSEPGNYTLGVEMTRIGSNPPPQPMRDDFSMSVVS